MESTKHLFRILLMCMLSMPAIRSAAQPANQATFRHSLAVRLEPPYGGDALHLSLIRYGQGEMSVVASATLGEDSTSHIWQWQDMYSRGLYFVRADGGRYMEFILSSEEDAGISGSAEDMMAGQVTISGSPENEAYYVFHALYDRMRREENDYYSSLADLDRRDVAYIELLSIKEQAIIDARLRIGQALDSLKVKFPGTFAADVLAPILALDPDGPGASTYPSFIAEHAFGSGRPMSPEAERHYFFEDIFRDFLNVYYRPSQNGPAVLRLAKATEKTPLLRAFVLEQLLQFHVRRKDGPGPLRTVAAALLPDAGDTTLAYFDVLRDAYAAALASCPGKVLYDATFLRNDGEAVLLSALAAGSRYTVLFFYSDECDVCAEVKPVVMEAASSWTPGRVSLVMINIDDSDDPLPSGGDFVRYVRPDRDVLKHIYIPSVPGLFLIDAGSRVVDRDLYGESLKQRLAELLE